ncbi:AI-2E family transporter [Acidomonas methanolica]|uniref:Transporter n=1 Tax=Acidomonas methanolica NBRC 104435 TaxID=1231351 RepID=A0A023D4G1_ACIMT|nr:AI-2E family transporter [Acidomonas methanolica]MBU2653274.1 AI-2E family transporter [Acidomonas methanolica]TCS32223.1 putative PurR-regulated permease PerM [Acidomonas methanolica]GAJ29027.1 transporter [Acidomonas methanolica NBRC 104435]GBQ52986.1 transporter [Acidomonas methanolica]GEK97657.1 AI-2E family transporter [Acidomonas methanolica NBRC 104435]
MTIERTILTLLLLGLAYGCGIILWPFLSAILWAAILTFTTWPLYVRLRRRMRPAIAAVLMMIGSAVVILLPLGLLTTTGISDIPGVVGALNRLMARLASSGPPPAWMTHLPGVGPQLAAAYMGWTHDLSTVGRLMQPYAGQIAGYALSALMLLASGIAELVMALFVALFFWINGDTLGRIINALLVRITGVHAQRFVTITGRVIRGTVYGVLGTAIIQGVLTALGLTLTGVPDPVLFGGLAAFFAVFPIGAPLVWIPAALWLVIEHRLGAGIFLGLYGVIVISGADHIIRPAFIARGAQLPYLLTVLGVLGGVLALGGLGIFLGPVLLGVGYTLTVEFAGAQPRPIFRDPVGEPPE